MRPVNQAGQKAAFYHLKQAGAIPDTFEQVALEIVKTYVVK